MIPQNEQGVVALFSEFASEMGYRFIGIGTRCPDAILQKDGKRVRVEFEYRALNFKKHGHNPDDVDLVICWEDDYQDCPIPVLSMEKYVTLSGGVSRSRFDMFVEGVKYFFNRVNEIYLHHLELRDKKRKADAESKAMVFCPLCGNKMAINAISDRITTITGYQNSRIRIGFFECDKCGLEQTKNVYEEL